jgi:hypothetical protein
MVEIYYYNIGFEITELQNVFFQNKQMRQSVDDPFLWYLKAGRKLITSTNNKLPKQFHMKFKVNKKTIKTIKKTFKTDDDVSITLLENISLYTYKNAYSEVRFFYANNDIPIPQKKINPKQEWKGVYDNYKEFNDFIHAIKVIPKMNSTTFSTCI